MSVRLKADTTAIRERPACERINPDATAAGGIGTEMHVRREALPEGAGRPVSGCRQTVGWERLDLQACGPGVEYRWNR